MKITLFAAAVFLTAVSVSAQETFPGLKSVMSATEWQRAGLDRLTPDELGVIDAALIRHQARATTQLQTELHTARQTVAAATTPSVATASGQADAPRGWLQRFGLPVFNDSDWRNMPPMRAKVTGWDGPNRFKLDNGQLWEGFEAITYELANKEIEIHARPHNQFTLFVDGQNTKIRVMRLR